MKAHQTTLPHTGKVSRWVGRANGAEKQLRQGATLIVPRGSWCELNEIQGKDPDVLRSPTINAAFDRIVAIHKPKHRIALISLCTSTRPYSISRKWGRYCKEFGGIADLIIWSNGGIVPIQYEDQFPFLNYDAHGEDQYDDLYVAIGHERLMRFFTAHRYDYLMFNFTHRSRNTRAAVPVLAELRAAGAIQGGAVMPTREQYEQSQRESFWTRGYKMFPELWPTMFNPMAAQMRTWHEQLKEPKSA